MRILLLAFILTGCIEGTETRVVPPLHIAYGHLPECGAKVISQVNAYTRFRGDDGAWIHIARYKDYMCLDRSELK